MENFKEVINNIKKFFNDDKIKNLNKLTIKDLINTINNFLIRSNIDGIPNIKHGNFNEFDNIIINFVL